MLKISIEKNHQQQFENQIYFVFEENFEDSAKKIKNLCDETKINYTKIFNANKFSGKAGQSILLVASSEENNQKILVVGIGKLNQTLCENLETVRNGIGTGISKAIDLGWTSCSMEIIKPKIFENISWQDWLSDFVTTCHLSEYKFTTFKTKNKTDKKYLSIIICLPVDVEVDFAQALQTGNILGLAVNSTRELANQPPNIAFPEYIAKKASLAAKENGFECTIFNKTEIEKMNMGGILAVGSGSTKECKFVELKIKAKNPSDKTIVLVGKGVTFDTGGVSLKPSRSMCNMKFDMSGAAAVLGVVCALAQLGSPVNVIGLMPLVENMPDGGSYRQDDIITHYDGTTTEVDNTDAEGRLILADSIAYAEDKYKPEIIVDIATLTGACVVALGHFFTGMMSNNKKISNIMESAGELCGEPVWLLPSISLYDRAIESKVADIVNTGKSGFDAGAITAGMFLKRFVKQASWIHLDIAGTECDLPINTYLGQGATGVGVRLLTKFIQSL